MGEVGLKSVKEPGKSPKEDEESILTMPSSARSEGSGMPAPAKACDLATPHPRVHLESRNKTKVGGKEHNFSVR